MPPVAPAPAPAGVRPPRPRPPAARAVPLAGLACMAGGAALCFDLAINGTLLHWGFTPGMLAVRLLAAVGLAGGPLGLLALGAAGPGWRRGLAAAGAALALLGALAYLVGFVAVHLDPAVAFRQRFTPGGSALLAAGMTLLGAAVLGARRLRGWRAVAPLLVGLYFPLQFPLQALFFLDGRGAPGPSPLLLGAWGALWVVLGQAIRSGAAEGERPTPTPAGDR